MSEVKTAPLPNSIKDLDWAAMWHQQMDRATFNGHGTDFWDNWARSLPVKTEHSGYVEELMSRLRLMPEYSILDIGAGTGAMTIPIARCVARVTALDNSAAMLDIIKQGAKASGLHNIDTIKLDWTTAQIGQDFQQHDVVLASRSLPSGKDITYSLKMIDTAAKHLCYITWKADSYDALEDELCHLLGVTYSPFPEYAVLYNVLLNLGITANIEIFKTRGERYYATLEEAYTQIVRSYPVSNITRDEIMRFLARRLDFRSNCYIQKKNNVWALIWWKKP